MGITIIIPTYNNNNYIDECLISVINSAIDFEFEILVGIDNCVSTLSHIQSKNYSDKIKFYFFEKNVGPYIVRNTLVLESKYDNLIFFDSDDIMMKNFVPAVLGYLNRYDCVKPKLVNFIYEFGEKKIDTKRRLWGEGVFGIKKSLFLSMNGFEGWMCAADSDFIGRLYKNKIRVLNTNEILMERRIHNQGLTSRRDTGFSSGLRSYYIKLSKSKKSFGPLEKMVTENFIKLGGFEIGSDFKMVPFKPNFNLKTESSSVTVEKIINKEQNLLLNKVLNPTPRKVVDKKVVKSNPVVVDRLEILYKNTPEPVRKIKTNVPENRQQLIDQKNNMKNTLNSLFPKKTNPKDGKNMVNFGGKLNR